MTEYLANKTRVLVTHQLQLLDKVDRIIVMDNGKIVAMGTYQQLLDRGVDFFSILKKSESKQGEEDEENSGDTSKEESEPSQDTPIIESTPEMTSNRLRKSSAGKHTAVKPEGKGKLSVAEEYAIGSVEWNTYKLYLTSQGGRFYFLLLLFLFTAAQGARSMSDWWLSFWSSHRAESPTSFYMLIYAGITVSCAVFTVFRALAIVNGGMTASRNIHTKLVQVIQFFHHKIFFCMIHKKIMFHNFFAVTC